MSSKNTTIPAKNTEKNGVHYLDNNTVNATPGNQQVKAKKRKNQQKLRTYYYSQRGVIQSFLYDEQYSNRVRFCGSALQNDVYICRNNDYDKLFYKNVAYCSNRWVCPVCSYRISIVQALRVLAAFQFYMKNEKIYFVTLTTQHSVNQSLAFVMDDLQQTKRITDRQQKTRWKYFSTLEVRWGEKNGWHPHYHLAIITNEPLTRIEKYVQKYIQNSKGATRQAQNIQEVKNHKDLAEYMSKIDLAQFKEIREKQATKITFELNNQNIKLSKKTLHPFEFIETGNGEKFKEYIEATFRKRMNNYSRRFFKDCKIDEKTDEELNRIAEKIDQVIYRIDKDIYNTLMNKNLLGEVLKSFERSTRKGSEFIKKYMNF